MSSFSAVWLSATIGPGGLTTQAQRQPPGMTLSGKETLEFHKTIAREVRGGCSLQRSLGSSSGGDDVSIGSGPIVHHFPNVGVDGHITVDCIIRPAPRPTTRNPTLHQDAHGRRTRIGAKRVGVLIVEVDEYGLTLDWKPGEVTDDCFLSPFHLPAGGETTSEPTKHRSGDGGPSPLDNLNDTGIRSGHDEPNDWIANTSVGFRRSPLWATDLLDYYGCARAWVLVYPRMPGLGK